MKRRDLGEHTFKLVFSIMNDNVFPDENFEYYFSDNEIDEKSAQYIRGSVEGVLLHLGEIDKAVLNNTKGYTFERISKVCLAVMRVAVYEIMYMETVPGNVSISEAIEIAEKYEDEKSKSFVNGILGAVFREYQISIAEKN